MKNERKLVLDGGSWVNEELDLEHVEGYPTLEIIPSGSAPSEATLDRIGALLSDIRPTLLLAARKIGEVAYDREHFKKLGVDERDLPENNAESIISY
ncbi:MAG: hypothetical protein R3F34_15485, partial [Planctomycetota bacterium]